MRGLVRVGSAEAYGVKGVLVFTEEIPGTGGEFPVSGAEASSPVGCHLACGRDRDQIKLLTPEKLGRLAEGKARFADKAADAVILAISKSGLGPDVYTRAKPLIIA